jgi:hypothetical protein
MRKIAIFLEFKIRLLFFSCEVFSREPTNPYGINKLLLSIVDKDMDETIIIEMAAENPPKN